MYTIGKAIRPVFADPVTNLVTFLSNQRIFNTKITLNSRNDLESFKSK